jgi:hypothetical protein
MGDQLRSGLLSWNEVYLKSIERHRYIKCRSVQHGMPVPESPKCNSAENAIGSI